MIYISTLDAKNLTSELVFYKVLFKVLQNVSSVI